MSIFANQLAKNLSVKGFVLNKKITYSQSKL